MQGASINLKAIVLVIFALHSSCTHTSKDLSFPYQLDQQGELCLLPSELSEISGLSYAGSSKAYCIQDENGKLYLLDIMNGLVLSEHDFGKNRDYEGIAFTGQAIYVLKSNGTLYKIHKPTDQAKLEAKKMTTSLNAACNAEGLCYDETNNRLLIACKDDAGKGKRFKKKKAVYAFNLKEEKLIKEPVFLLEIPAIQKLERAGGTHKAYQAYVDSKGGKSPGFNPSGIAVHPVTKEIYLIASSGKTLAVLSSEGQLQKAVHLDPVVFKQPEGITFNERGDLIISNEAGVGRANIQIFKYLSPSNP